MNVPSASRALALVACLALLAPGVALGAKKPAPKPKPDLSIVTSVSVSGKTTAGATIDVTTAVAAGKKLPTKASKTAFFLSTDAVRDKKDTQLTVVGTRAIKAAKSAPVATKITLPATLTGSFYIIACADGANKIAESSEKNNCRASARETIRTATLPEAPKPTGPVATTVRLSAARGSAEGNSGTANRLEYDISLNAASTAAVTVNWTASASGTAETNDFVASAGTATIPAGQTKTTVTVPIVGDTTPEDDDEVRVVLSSPTGATLSTSSANASILDDDLMTASVETELATRTSVTLRFSSLTAAVAADGSQFTIPGLAVTGASANGRYVTLTTARQDAMTYTINLAPNLKTGLRTVPASKNFSGLGAAGLEITELNANIAGGADLVELRATSSGSTDGAVLSSARYAGADLDIALPPLKVANNDYILVHLGNPAGLVSETTSKTSCALVSCKPSWDLAVAPSLTLSAMVLTVVDGDDELSDGVVLRLGTAPATDATLLANLNGLADDGFWGDCGGACTTGVEYGALAADWSTTGTTATGTSLRRTTVDDDEAADWSVGASHWGASS